MKAVTYPPSLPSTDESAHICLDKKLRGRRKKKKKKTLNIINPCMNALKKPGKASTVFFFLQYRSATGAAIKIVRFPKQILFLMKCSPAIILYTPVTVLHYIVLQGPRNMKLFSN